MTDVRPSPKKPRILFFLPSLVAGGAEIHALALCQQLRDRGFDCVVLVHGLQFSDSVMEKPAARSAIRLNLHGMSDPVGWLKIWRQFRRTRPDIIVSINQTPLIISLIEKLAFATGAALACIFHSTEMAPDEKYLASPFRIAARQSDLLVYVGEAQRRIWEGRGFRARRTQVIPNGIDLAEFSPATGKREEVRSGLKMSEDDFVLGIVAAFRPEKNHRELLLALDRARRAGSRAKVLAIGEGPTLARTKAMALALGIGDRVLFTGGRSDISRCISACDAGVLCSTQETFPLAALEFLASGTPMLVSSVSGALELVKPEFNGLAHAPGDIGQFAANILRMEKAEDRAAFARNARGSVERYSEDKMVAAYIEEFLNLHV